MSRLFQDKIFIKLLILTLLTVFCFNFTLFAEEPVAMDQFNKLLQRALSLIMEANPLLQSQQRIIDKYKVLTIPEGKDISMDLKTSLGSTIEDGDLMAEPEIGVGIFLPLFSPSSELKTEKEKIRRVESLESNVQEYEQMKEELVTGFTARVSELVELVHRFEGKKRFLQTLYQRQDKLRDLINTGVAEPKSMWELDEKINTIEIEVADLKSNQIILINKIGENFGGSKKQEVKNVLTKIIKGNRIVKEYEGE